MSGPAVAADATHAPRAPRADRDDARQRTLGEAARFFLRKATPRIVGPLLVLAVVGRVLVGDVGWDDLVVVGALLALQPFTEWGIHVYVLHARPFTIGGRTFDLHAAKEHRHHHRNPHDPDTAFVPLVDLFGLGALLVVVLAVATGFDGGRLLTAIITGLAILLVYEWTHYLIHTPYRPKGRYYRYVWRAHRLHHFKNEHYWMGVTVHLADHVLGTFPAKSEVETSPTARTLGIGDA